MFQNLFHIFRFRTRITLVLAFLWVIVVAEKTTAQTYTDSTIVYLEWMTDPLRTIVINWIETEDLESINVRYRVRGSSDPWITTIGSMTDIPDVPVVRKTVQLSNLTPNTSYEFQIKADTISHYFRTLPPTLNTRVRFIVTGDVYGDGTDPEIETQNFEEIAFHAASIRPHFAVLAGDLVHLTVEDRYDESTILRSLKFLYEWYTNMVTPQGELIPIVAALGNHELQQKFGGVPEDAVYFNALFNFPGIQGYRVLDFANYLSLIILNTNHTRPVEGAQTTWLQSRLADRTNVTNVFPVYHVPAYPSRREAIPGRGLEVLQNWVPLFEQYNVKFAFEHDNHAYKRTFPIKNNEINPCGVRYFGDGGFAYPTGPVDTTKWYIQQHWDARHFNYVDLTSSNRSVRTIAYTGAELDGFSQNTQLIPPGVSEATNIGSSSFTANWNPVCVANQYRVDVSSDPNFASFLPGYQNLNVGNNLSVNVTGLSPTTQYYYRVRAIDTAAGNTSGNSNSMTVSTSSVPPTALAATNVAINSFTANWQFVSGANQYRIDVATDQQFQNILPAYNNRDVGNTTSFNVTGVNSATTYYYRVRARNTSLNVTSANSGLIGLITKPEIPQLLPPASLTSNSFMVRWNPVPRVDQYRLDVSTNENFSSFIDGYQNFIINNSTAHTVTGLNPQTRYYFRVRARNTALEVTSDNSLVSNVSTLPESPKNIMATAQTDSSFVLNWDKVNNTDTYLIDIALNQQFTQFLPGYNNRELGDVNSIIVEALTPQTIYYIRIRAKNTSADLTSLSSDSFIAATLPPSPENLVVSDLGARFFTLTWDSIEGVDDYLIDLSLDQDFDTFLEGFEDLSTGKTNTYDFNNLLPSVTYYFRVRSVNSTLDVISSESEIVEITTLPDPPGGLQISTIESNKAVLSWAQNETADQFYVDLSDDIEFTNFIDEYENLSIGNNLSVNFEGLIPVQTYFARIRVKNETTGLTSFNSEVVEFTTIPSTPLLVPASSITAVRFTAKWLQVDNVSYYQIDLAYDDQFESIHQNFVDFNMGDVSQFEFHSLDPGRAYYFRIRAVNEQLNLISAYSETAEVRTIAVDLNLSTLIADKNSLLADGLTFSTMVATIRDSDQNPLEEVNVMLVADNGTSEIEVLQGRTDIAGRAIFTVKNVTAERNTYSAIINNNALTQTVTLDFTPIPPSFNQATNIRASTLTLNWEPIAGATDYKLDFSTNPNFTSFVESYSDFSTGNVESYQISNLFPGITYYARLRAVAVTGTSGNSEAISVTTPQADPNLTEVIVVDEVVLADGITKGNVRIIIRGSDGLPMDGVPVQLISGESRSVVSATLNPSNEVGLVIFDVSNDLPGEVEYTVIAGSVEIVKKAKIDFRPVPPLNNGSSLVGAVEFTATWEPIEGATTYFFDLSINQDFSTYVTGFENRDVGNITELIIDGLEPGRTYYFRVRAATNTSTSDDSNVVEVTTFVIDTEKSTVEATLQRVLANGEQESTISIKLVSESGQALPDVRVRITTNNVEFIVIPSEEVTNEDGIATFITKSSLAGEAVYRVNAGGVELETELNILYLFADGIVKLGHNFPNPFGFITKIPITIPERMNVKLHIFNSSGLLVDVLTDQEYAAGYYEIEFRPRGLASGVYLCRMVTSDGVQVEKMLYIK